MDTSDPDIEFDSDGVCNHCKDYDRTVLKRVPEGEEALQQLQTIINTIRREGAGKRYDCVIGVSGGVDSTYVAKKVKEFGLRPLTIHLDNGWDSEIAVSNIARALNKLGLDLYSFVIDWEEFKDIQRSFLLASTPDAEIPTDHAIFATLHQQAKRIGVRFIITGLNVRTEMHMPRAWSQGHLDWLYIRSVHRQFGSGHIKTFPHFGLLEGFLGPSSTYVFVDILNYLNYSKTEALVVLEQELGWKDYGGKHHESTYTRWFQGCYLPRKFGFDKRRAHLSSRVCSGELTREAALMELQSPPYPLEQQAADCEYVAKKLGFTVDEFAKIMTAPPRRFEEFPSYAKWARSGYYKAALQVWRVLKYRILRRSPA